MACAQRGLAELCFFFIFFPGCPSPFWVHRLRLPIPCARACVPGLNGWTGPCGRCSCGCFCRLQLVPVPKALFLLFLHSGWSLVTVRHSDGTSRLGRRRNTKAERREGRGPATAPPTARPAHPQFPVPSEQLPAQRSRANRVVGNCKTRSRARDDPVVPAFQARFSKLTGQSSRPQAANLERASGLVSSTCRPRPPVRVSLVLALACSPPGNRAVGPGESGHFADPSLVCDTAIWRQEMPST